MRRISLYVFWTAMLPLGSASGAAQAGPLSNIQMFGQFNAIIFGNFTISSEVQGRTVVGGTISGGGNYDFNPNNATASSFAALSVYGSIASGGDYNINGAGGVAIAGSNNATLNLNTAGPVYIGGANSGAISGAASSVGIIGTNSGTLSVASGSVYVGGANARGGAANAGSITVNGSATNPWIAINGNNAGSLTMNGGAGSAAVNGNNAGTINGGVLSYTGSSQTGNLNGGATAAHVASLTLAPPVSTLGSFSSTFVQPLTQLSTQLANVAANSTATLVSGSLTFNATPNSAGVAIFDINSSQFAGASTIRLNLAGATSAIINVNVDSCVSAVCSFNPTVNFNDTSYASVLLWNFLNATNLNFTTEFGGSILAPYAAITDSSPVDGTVVAASMNTSSELHSYAYTGTFPGSTVAPEPTSLALIGPGIVGLAFLRRRKRWWI